MKYLSLLFLFIIIGSELKGQKAGESKTGNISYMSSQNIYVKFQSTETIAEGDTLFSKKGDTLLPVLIVKAVSSTSCVCIPISTMTLAVSDQVITKAKTIQPKQPAETPAAVSVIPVVADKDSVTEKKSGDKKRKQIISGRVAVSSYLNFSSENVNSQRMRYTFSFTGQNLGNSKFSAETYMSFVHKLDEWSEIKEDVFNGLKIYNLSVSYEFNKNNKVWFGRKINPRISSMGAIDGLQYELKLKSFTIGLVGGFRPDYEDYGFNFDLLQFGGYVGHDYSNRNGTMQTTLAFLDQLNSGKTDRQFLYLQHTNALVKNLYFFGSVELDLYNKVMNYQDSTLQQDNKPSLTNLYLSLRYRPIRQLSLSVSYSSRQNIIYYETYKDIVERLLEETALQGVTLQVSYQPVKKLSIGANVGYRDNKNDPRSSKNFYGYVTYSRIPGIDVSATGSYTWLETSYLSGNIYSIGISRDLVSGKLFLGLNYRYVDYRFVVEQPDLGQNMGEFNLTWRILKKLSCSFYYEGTFDKADTFNRVYINLTQRF